MRRIHFDIFGVVLSVILLCYIVFQCLFPAIAKQNSFVVSSVEVHQNNLCDYSIGQRDGKIIHDHFTLRARCGLYFAGDNILLIRGMPDSVRIKQ